MYQIEFVEERCDWPLSFVVESQVEDFATVASQGRQDEEEIDDDSFYGGNVD